MKIIKFGGASVKDADGVRNILSVLKYTGFKEMLDGRVKTLNPKIYSSILYIRNKESHRKQFLSLKIPEIDMVIVNLYPFEKFINANGFIFCAPEYNGSIPPVLTNLFAWISVSTNHWRDVFINKKAIIATHSGGGGNNLIQSMRIQLCHLGIVVLPRTIIVNKYSKFVEESTKEKIQQLYDLF